MIFFRIHFLSCICLIQALLSSPVLSQTGLPGGIWKGAGQYAQGLPITTVMKKMRAGKSINMEISPAGSVSGTLSITYNRLDAALDPETDGQRFTLGGMLDAGRKILLLTITHIQADGSSGITAFKRPDSIYYEVSFYTEQGKSIMKATAAAWNKNLSSEWIGSSEGKGLGMNIEDNITMHVLPFSIRLEQPIQEKKDTAVARTTTFIAKRKTEIQQTILLDTSYIKLELYDNGIPDGDTATLILDGRTILENRLTGLKPLSLSLNLPRNKEGHLLELFAVNLGSIPPNTTLLVLTCGNKRHEITLSSTKEINGSVRLKIKGE